MYRDREWWGTELQIGLTAFACLMAVLIVFSAVDGVFLALRDTTNPDRIGEALAWTLVTPVHRLNVPFAQFFLASFLGFRLLVPTFAGAPPRAVAVVVVTWPLAFAGLVNYGNLSNALWFGAIGVSWALILPLPKKNLLTYGPIIAGIIAGLAFGSFAQPSVGLEVAIIWCAWRLYRRHLDEVAATSIAAAFLPAAVAVHNPAAMFTGPAVYTTTLIAILLALATAALLFSQFNAGPPDETADATADATANATADATADE